MAAVYTAAICKNHAVTAMLPAGVSGVWGALRGWGKSLQNVRRDSFR